MSASVAVADRIAAAALAAPTVARLHGGPGGGEGTYLPGVRITGVRVHPEQVVVHVVGRYGPTVAEIAADVRRTVGPIVAGRPVHVVVGDLA